MDMLEYYGAEEIIPVHQSLPRRDFGRFMFQRRQLYRNLGVEMALLEGKSILEFGPGTGDNAEVLAAFHPSVLDLVDGNGASLQSLQEKISSAKLPGHITSIYHSDARTFSLAMRSKNDEVSKVGYHLVICEGVINGNPAPSRFLETISSFVRPGGILVITTVDPWGVLDQALRRLWKPAVVAKYKSRKDHVKCLSAVFQSHLSNLATTKPIGDWVEDAILHPINQDYVFSTPEALAALGAGFVVMGSSPRFHADFRWHKSLDLAEDKTNFNFLEQYEKIRPMFLDDRFQDTSATDAFTANTNMHDLNAVITQIWRLSCSMWERNSYEQISELQSLLIRVMDATRRWFPEIHDSIGEFVVALPGISKGNFDGEMPAFKKWWGRGLMYASVVKR